MPINSYFDPMLYIDENVTYLDADNQNVHITDTDKLVALVNEVKGYLRDKHGALFRESYMSPEHRQKVRFLISDYIKDHVREKFLTPVELVIEYVQNEITNLGILQKYLDDPSVTNINFRRYNAAYIEQNGVNKYVPELKFLSEDHMYAMIDRILLPHGDSLSASKPSIDALYNKGMRICAVYGSDRGGISIYGPILSIRKFSPDVFTDEYMISYGYMNSEIRDFLADVVPGGANIGIGGSTNSAKTTALMRLPLYLSPDDSIITIEDSPEMMLMLKAAYKDYNNVASLQSKYYSGSDKSLEYTIGDNLVVSLRLSPEWLIVGEIRKQKDAAEAVQAANTGHIVYTTIHCNSAKDFISRVAGMMKDPTAVPDVVSAFDIIIFQRRLKNGRKVITEIAELTGYTNNYEPLVSCIFKYDFKKSKHYRIGVISSELADKLRSYFIPEENVQRWLVKENVV